MSTLKQKKKYIVLSKNGINKLIKEEELNRIDIQNILTSDINISFYESLPKGTYEFGKIKVAVDKLGNITIGNKTLSPVELSKLNKR